MEAWDLYRSAWTTTDVFTALCIIYHLRYHLWLNIWIYSSKAGTFNDPLKTIWRGTNGWIITAASVHTKNCFRPPVGSVDVMDRGIVREGTILYIIRPRLPRLASLSQITNVDFGSLSLLSRGPARLLPDAVQRPSNSQLSSDRCKCLHEIQVHDSSRSSMDVRS